MSKDEIKSKIRDAIVADPSVGEINRASLFGSYLHGNERADSDVDLLVEFKPSATVGLFELVSMQRRIGDFLGKKVDLLTPNSISKFFRDKVLDEAELIYEGR